MDDEEIGDGVHAALSSCDIMIVMAYSNDYTIGNLCQQVNECYAKQHGYSFFVADVQSPEEMINVIKPKLHFTWYKIYLLLKLMSDEANQHIKYFFWVDGDALVLNMNSCLQDYITKGDNKDLIIAEDMHTCCLINAGVFFIKNSSWSLSLLQDVWQYTKYNEVYYYEQSALIKCLGLRKERLNRLSPFHSFVANGPEGVKYFPHVAVFPHPQFSSNVGVSKEDYQDYLLRIASPIPISQDDSIKCNQTQLLKEDINTEEAKEEVPEEDRKVVLKQLIYHAAGLNLKLDYLRVAIHKYHLMECFSEEAYQRLFTMKFKLNRTKLGHYRPGVKDERNGDTLLKEMT